MTKYKAPALAKGLDIIDLIKENGALSFNDLQTLTEDNPASLSRYLHTLIAKNYIHKNRNQKYELGIKLLGISDNRSLADRLKSSLLPLMHRINQEYDITTLLLLYVKDQYMAIEKVIAKENLGMMARNSVYGNTVHSLWSNCYYQPDAAEQLDALYESSLEHVSDGFTKAMMQEIIRGIKENGYMTLQLDHKKIDRYGFPIRLNGHVVATLGVGTFQGLISDTDMTRLKKEIMKGIRDIEQTLQLN